MGNELLLSDYAIIGNGQTAALVSRHGSIDWCCWPRFDSPALFCRLLDDQRGGFFQIAPADTYQVNRSYLDDTNVLISEFTTKTGSLRLTDLMPAPKHRGGRTVFPHRLLRLVECTSGSVPIEIYFKPTFDFARKQCRFEFRERGVLAADTSSALSLVCSLPLRVEGDLVRGGEKMSAGDRLWVILTHGSTAKADHFFKWTPNRARWNTSERWIIGGNGRRNAVTTALTPLRFDAVRSSSSC